MTEGKKAGRVGDMLRAFYFLCMAGTATSELLVVYIATLGSAKVLTSSEVHYATCGITVLMQGFELEYLLCRCFLLVGIIMLLWGLGVRSLLNYLDLDPEEAPVERRALLASSALFASLTPALVAYADQNAPTKLRPTVLGLPTFWSMCQRVMHLGVENLKVSTMGRLSLFGFAASAVLVGWSSANLLLRGTFRPGERWSSDKLLQLLRFGFRPGSPGRR